MMTINYGKMKHIKHIKEAIIALKNDEVFTAEEKAYYTIQLEKHLQKQLLE